MDSYSIGVSIMLATNAPQVLNLISTRVLGLHTHVGQVNNQFARMATLIGGVGAALAGSALIEGMVKLVEHGSKINHELELMKNQSFSVKEINEAMAAAIEVSGRVQQTTVAENLKHIRELRYAFGDTADAVKWLDVVSKANIVANSYAEKFGLSGLKDQVFDLVKGEEMKGLTANPAEFASMMDVWIKAMIASGGKVTAANFLGTMKYARTAGLGWDETFMGQYLPRLMQEYSTGGSGGAGGPGNALMSAFQAIVRGQMSKTSAEAFQRFGLATATHIGGSSQSHLGPVAGGALFQKNPYEWVQQVLMPALAAQGVTTPEGVVEALSKMFSNRTAGDIITKMALQGRYAEGANSPFEKDAKLARMAQGILSAYDELSKYDWQTNMIAFNAQWENFIENLGSPLVQNATEILHDINNALAGFAKWAGEHPAGIKYTLEAITAIAGGLVVAGIVAVIGAIAGLVGIVGGVVAVVTALGLLVAFNWNALAAGISSLWNSLTDAFSFSVTDLGVQVGRMLSDSILNALKGALGLGGGGAATPGAAPTNPYVPGYSDPGGAFIPGSYNAVPPPSGAGHGGMTSAAIYMDGQKVGELVTRRIADRGSRPTEGSAHFDPTWGAWPADVRA